MISVMPLAILGIVGGMFLARWSYNSNSSKQLFNMIQKVPWRGGIILLIINLLIIGITVLLFVSYPYLPGTSILTSRIFNSVISFGAPFVSVFTWLTVKYHIGGAFRRRFVVSIIGQSVYGIFLTYSFYRYFTIEPFYPGEDVFMRTLGMVMIGFISLCAILIGIVALSSPLPQHIKNKTSD